MKKAFEMHPDKNKDDQNANEKFQKINEAYGILKDEQKRRDYDLHGIHPMNSRDEQKEIPKTKDITQQIDVTLYDLYNGNKIICPWTWYFISKYECLFIM